MYLWMKALHIIFMVTWFAGLFYLPRLYVYHAMPENKPSFDLFKIMERRLFIMMTLGAGLTVLFGSVLIVLNTSVMSSAWFHAKLTLILLLLIYHYACFRIMIAFRQEQNTRSHKWYRYFNEAPSLLLMGIVILVVTKLF
ncbi:MAG TPA: protoporphyrinogen oxidase HemJ [Thiothrix sp.]|nr:protoporphyrinogen oxidase HemJ [Thiothrix sp.]